MLMHHAQTLVQVALVLDPLSYYLPAENQLGKVLSKNTAQKSCCVCTRVDCV